MQKLYTTQIVNVNFYKHKELYKNKNSNFLEKLENEDNGLYLDLILFYNSNYNNEIEIKNVITNTYLYNQKKIEEAIGIWVDYLLTVLYEINVIEELNNIISINKERNQKSFNIRKCNKWDSTTFINRTKKLWINRKRIYRRLFRIVKCII